MVKNPPANAGDMRDAGSIPGSGRSLGGGNGNPLQYSLPGESHGQRSLVGYSPQGGQESHTTEATWHTHFTVLWPTRAFQFPGCAEKADSLGREHSVHFVPEPQAQHTSCPGRVGAHTSPDTSGARVLFCCVPWAPLKPHQLSSAVRAGCRLNYLS